MNSQEMNIYWNQSKGQYETNDFYQSVQHPFTITADNRLKYQEETLDSDKDSDDLSEESVSIASWFGTMVLLLIPGLNIIAALIMSFAAKNENKKAFARALVLITLVCITLMLVVMALTCDKIDYKSIIDKVLDFSKLMLVRVKNVI